MSGPTLETWSASQLKPGEWPVGLELLLFEATARYRPVGINGHINMALLHQELQTRVPDVTPDMIWEHIRIMYNMPELDSGEGPSWHTYVQQEVEEVEDDGAEEQGGAAAGGSGGAGDDGGPNGVDYIDFRLPASFVEGRTLSKRKRA